MLVTDFDYELPKELIAQHPMEPRDHSRLLVVNKDSGVCTALRTPVPMWRCFC